MGAGAERVAQRGGGGGRTSWGLRGGGGGRRPGPVHGRPTVPASKTTGGSSSSLPSVHLLKVGARRPKRHRSRGVVRWGALRSTGPCRVATLDRRAYCIL